MYLGQTTRDLEVYSGSSDVWTKHIEEHGDDFKKIILFESTDRDEFKRVSIYYSKLYDVVKNDDFANRVEEWGGSLGGAANPNYKTGEFIGRLDNPELYKKSDRKRYRDDPWEGRKHRIHPRMNFYYHKRKGNREMSERYWNIWYDLAPKNSNNRQALQETDTFEMWYNRKGNDLNFRTSS